MNSIHPTTNDNDQLSMLGEEDPGSAFDPIFNTEDSNPAQPAAPPSMQHVVWTGLVLLLGGVAWQRWMSGRHRH